MTTKDKVIGWGGVLLVVLGTVFLIAALVFGPGCNIPSQKKIDATIAMTCQVYVAQALAKVDEVLAQCEDRADHAEEVCKEQVDGILADVQKLIDDTEADVMRRLGCVADSSSWGYWCPPTSPLCRLWP